MEILKNRRVASLIVTVVVIAATLFGINRSLAGQVKKIDASFYEGVYNSEEKYLEPSIENLLGNKINAALGVVTVLANAPGAEAEAENLRQARLALVDAETIPQKYDANEKLTEVFNAAEDLLRSGGLSEDDLLKLDTYSNSFHNAERMIKNSRYNSEVKNFEDSVLSGFPMNILKYLTFTGNTEYFA